VKIWLKKGSLPSYVKLAQFGKPAVVELSVKMWLKKGSLPSCVKLARFGKPEIVRPRARIEPMTSKEAGVGSRTL